VNAAFRVIAILCIVNFSAAASAQSASAPEILGRFTGERSPQQPSNIQLYGTDLGWTFEHDGVVQVLFGDSWPTSSSLCEALSEGLPTHDDTQGLLPLEYTGGVPPVTFATRPDSPDQFRAIEVFRDSVLLPSGQNAAAMTAWSDGTQAIGLFQQKAYVACSPSADGAAPTCPEPFTCVEQIGQCQPSAFGVPLNCDLAAQSGCLQDQTCEAVAPGFCVDPTSSALDATQRVPLELELSVPRLDEPTRYDSKFTFRSSKFLNPASRTVRRLSRYTGWNDYRPGYDSLLMWGRPGFVSDERNNLQLYLLSHDLPLATDAQGKFVFRPRYFAGLDRFGRPTWSRAQEDAAPLALDGQVNGDPTEVLTDINQMSISWLGEPINRWLMLYGGGTPLDPNGPTTTEHAGVPGGSIAVRYAKHPWGPWSPPEPHLMPGDPSTPLALYGPGGWLYHPACVDAGGLTCERTDPSRFLHLLDPNCAAPQPETDYGVLYGPNIIDAYTTRSSSDTLEVYWNVSTWNPYVTLFVHSTFSAHD
jgi:hypothetical protein